MTLRMTLTRRVDDPASQSVFGMLHIPDMNLQWMTCEREWKNNRPGESCVPVGFYVLEPHNGAKYKDTYALIGETVDHHTTSTVNNVTRTACVLHWASMGRHLQGCIAIGDHVGLGTQGGVLGGKVNGKKFLTMLNKRRDDIYLTIQTDYSHIIMSP